MSQLSPAEDKKMDPLCRQDGILIDGLNLMAAIQIYNLCNEYYNSKTICNNVIN